jgi:hypothetical protein
LKLKIQTKKIAEKKHPKSSSTQPKIKSMFLVDKPCQYPLKKSSRKKIMQPEREELKNSKKVKKNKKLQLEPQSNKKIKKKK